MMDIAMMKNQTMFSLSISASEKKKMYQEGGPFRSQAR